MDKDQCLKLISLYSVNTWLWNAGDPNHTNRGLREDAWVNISREMNMPVPDIKKKMESLLGSYRREKSREKRSLLTRSGRGDVYKSNWFAYTAFAFMSERNEPGTTRDTMEYDASVNSQIDSQETQNEDSDEQNNTLVSVEQKTRNYARSSGSMTPSFSGRPLNRKRKIDMPIDRTIKELKSNEQNVEHNMEDEFDLFCKSLAVQLKKMPLDRALVCQEQLQSVMTHERLSQMSQSETIYSDASPTSPYYTFKEEMNPL